MKGSNMPQDDKLVNDLARALPIDAQLHVAEDGRFWVDSRQLGGCFAEGATPREALHNFKFAMFEYFDIPLDKQNPNQLGLTMNDLPEPNSKSSHTPEPISFVKHYQPV